MPLYRIALGTTGPDGDPQKASIIIERIPTWAPPVEAAGLLLDRSPIRWVRDLGRVVRRPVDRRRDWFEVTADRQEVARFATWRGWDPDGLEPRWTSP